MTRKEIDKLLDEAQLRYKAALKQSQWEFAATCSRHINELLLKKASSK